MTEWTRDERIRYGRHLLLPEIGPGGQRLLREASVLVVGAGGLGCPAALYLAAAGVGRIGIVDDDRVALSNLQRQVLYGTDDVGAPKVDRAALRLRGLNPEITIEPIPLHLDRENAVSVIAGFDVVVDATDRFATRYLLADASSITGRPVVYGAVHRFEGQVSVFGLPGRACYRCLYPTPPPPALAPSCGEAGVLGAATGVVGCLQAAEVIKLITGAGEPLAGRLLLVNLLAGDFTTIDVPVDPGCRDCGPGASPGLDTDYEDFCGTGPATEVPSITATELRDRLDGDVVLLDVRQAQESLLVSIGGLRIPESELPHRLDELGSRRDTLIVAYCRRGVRSARAAALLRATGYPAAVHLDGGLEAWAARVDPELPLY